ncbi:MAG: hypothetical protein HY657_11515 [Acidobacteria bacterium]|nr:hypothetical protein [Acidobacteriota bacterium]
MTEPQDAMSKRVLVLGRLVVALGAAWFVLQPGVGSQAQREAPLFEVDSFWPKPLPDHWLLGSTIGLWVDDRDRVWIIHRGSATLDPNERTLELDSPTAVDCCTAAPPVLEFDAGGSLVGSWGGPDEGTSGPPRITGSRSTTRETSGSAATARETRTS